MPSDVSFLDTDGDGLVDRGYVVDVRANVYRIDMESSRRYGERPDRLGDHQARQFNDGRCRSRRVYFAPDVVRTKNYIA